MTDIENVLQKSLKLFYMGLRGSWNVVPISPKKHPGGCSRGGPNFQKNSLT